LTDRPAYQFPTTHWTGIVQAQGSEQERKGAFQDLLAAYWQPLYFYVRRRGTDVEAAQEKIQAFYLHLLEKDFVSKLNPEVGRLRNYLKTSLNNFLVDEHQKSQRQKRGGDVATVTMDFEVAENALGSVPEDPEKAYNRQWAMKVMGRCLERLREEYDTGERSGPFTVLEQLFQFGELPPYAEIAKEYEMSVSQVKVFVHRARARFRNMVLEEVAHTVSDSEEVDAEVNELFDFMD